MDLDPSLQTGPIRKAAWTSAWHDSQVPVSAIHRDESWGEKVWPQSPRGPASGDGLRRRFVSGIRAQEPGLLVGRSGKEQGGEGESGRGEMLRAAAAASPGGDGGHGAPPPQLLTPNPRLLASWFTPLFPPARALHAGQAASWAGLTFGCHISLPFPPRDPQQSLGFGQLPQQGSTETFRVQPSATTRRPAFSSMRQAWAPPFCRKHASRADRMV